MRSKCTIRRPAPDRRRVLFYFQGIREEEIMARSTSQQQSSGQRAAIYARVSDKSQDNGGQDLHFGADFRYGDPLPAQGADHHRPLPGGGQRMVEETPGVPEDAGRRQAGTLRHHRVLEVRPAQPGHVPGRRPHGGRRGVPDRARSRLGRHRHEDLRPHGGHRQDRAGQLPGALLNGQARLRQAGPRPGQQRPLRLPPR